MIRFPKGLLKSSPFYMLKNKTRDMVKSAKINIHNLNSISLQKLLLNIPEGIEVFYIYGEECTKNKSNYEGNYFIENQTLEKLLRVLEQKQNIKKLIFRDVRSFPKFIRSSVNTNIKELEIFNLYERDGENIVLNNIVNTFNYVEKISLSNCLTNKFKPRRILRNLKSINLINTFITSEQESLKNLNHHSINNVKINSINMESQKPKINVYTGTPLEVQEFQALERTLDTAAIVGQPTPSIDYLDDLCNKAKTLESVDYKLLGLEDTQTEQGIENLNLTQSLRVRFTRMLQNGINKDFTPDTTKASRTKDGWSLSFR